MNEDQSEPKFAIRSYTSTILTVFFFLFALLLSGNPDFYLISFIVMVLSIIGFVLIISTGVDIESDKIILRRFSSNKSILFSEIDKLEVNFSLNGFPILSLFFGRERGFLDVICYKNLQKDIISFKLIHSSKVSQLIHSVSQHTRLDPTVNKHYSGPVGSWIWNFSSREREEKLIEMSKQHKHKRNFFISLTILIVWLMVIVGRPFTPDFLRSLPRDTLILFIVIMFYFFVGFLGFVLTVYHGRKWYWANKAI